MTDLVVKDLHRIIEKHVDPVMFPYEKSGKINIGSYSIVKGKDCYTIKSYKSKTIVAQTFSKTAAVAAAKTLSKNKNNLRRILELDHKIMKHYIDCMFYKNSMKKTKNEITRETIEVRYDISWHKVEDARKKLEHFIF